MRGRWAAGIVPRNFAWIVKDRLAVSERPGGYAPHHRRVRRHEELLWLRGQGFTRVVSLLGSSHNLHAYEEHHLPATHFPLPMHGDLRPVLGECYPALLEWLRAGERVLVHHEELGDRAAGVAAGFLCWCGLVPDAPQAIMAVEHLLKRQLGSLGRSIVAAAGEVAPPPPGASLRPRPAPAAEVRAIGARAPRGGRGPGVPEPVLSHAEDPPAARPARRARRMPAAADSATPAAEPPVSPAPTDPRPRPGRARPGGGRTPADGPPPGPEGVQGDVPATDEQASPSAPSAGRAATPPGAESGGHRGAARRGPEPADPTGTPPSERPRARRSRET